MGIPPFDASKAVRIDLTRGQIQLPDEVRGLLLPSGALTALFGAADAATVSAFARSVGESIGQRVRAKITAEGATVREAPIEAVVEHLAGHWGVTGLGHLELERWGRALVVVVDDVPTGEADDRLIAPMLAAAISAASEAQAHCVRLHRDGARARFVVVSEKGAERVRSSLSSGTPWAEALVRLHASGGDA
jgi:hypothetical protein